MAYTATDVPGAAVAMVSVFGQPDEDLDAGAAVGAGAGLAHPKPQASMDKIKITLPIQTTLFMFFLPFNPRLYVRANGRNNLSDDITYLSKLL